MTRHYCCMERIDPVAAARVLTAILERRGGAESAFEALGEFDGIVHDPGRSRSWRRAAAPPSVTVGDWVFTATGPGAAIGVQHAVRGVVLSRSVQPAGQAATVLAAALAELTEKQGPDHVILLQAWLAGWGDLLGLPQ